VRTPRRQRFLNKLTLVLGSGLPSLRPKVIEHLVCWLLHRRQREILIPGILPYGFDAVVFCWRCDKFRGRGLQVLDLSRPAGRLAS